MTAVILSRQIIASIVCCSFLEVFRTGEFTNLSHTVEMNSTEYPWEMVSSAHWPNVVKLQTLVKSHSCPPTRSLDAVIGGPGLDPDSCELVIAEVMTQPEKFKGGIWNEACCSLMCGEMIWQIISQVWISLSNFLNQKTDTLTTKEVPAKAFIKALLHEVYSTWHHIYSCLYPLKIFHSIWQEARLAIRGSTWGLG